MVRKDENFHNLQKQKEICKEFTDIVKFEEPQINTNSSESDENSRSTIRESKSHESITNSNKENTKTTSKIYKRSKTKCSYEDPDCICCDLTVCYTQSDSSVNPEDIDFNNKNTESFVNLKSDSITNIVEFLKIKFDELNDIYNGKKSSIDNKFDPTNKCDVSYSFVTDSFKVASEYDFELKNNLSIKVPRLSSGASLSTWQTFQEMFIDAKHCCGSRQSQSINPCTDCKRVCCSKLVANKKWFWIPEKKTTEQEQKTKACADLAESSVFQKDTQCPKAKYKCVLKKFQSELNKIDKIIAENSVLKKSISAENNTFGNCFDFTEDRSKQENLIQLKSALEASKTKLKKLCKMLDAKSFSRQCKDCCKPKKRQSITVITKKKKFDCTAGKCRGDCRYVLLHSPPVYRPVSTCDETKSDPLGTTLQNPYECSCKQKYKNCKCKKQCKKNKTKYETACNPIKKMCYTQLPTRKKYGDETAKECVKIIETVGDLIYAADECKEKSYRERSKKIHRRRKKLLDAEQKLMREKLFKCDRFQLKCIETCAGSCGREECLESPKEEA